MHTSSSPARRRAFTLVELLITVTIIAILAGLTFAVSSSVIQQARKTQARATMENLRSGIAHYLTEYNRLPVATGDADAALSTDSASGVIATLMGEDDQLNPLGKTFFSSSLANSGRGGLIDAGGAQVSLHDPWGQPYHLLLDANGDERIRPNPDQFNEDARIANDAPEVLRTRAAIFSNGPDGERGTRDDLVTWR